MVVRDDEEVLLRVVLVGRGLHGSETTAPLLLIRDKGTYAEASRGWTLEVKVKQGGEGAGSGRADVTGGGRAVPVGRRRSNLPWPMLIDVQSERGRLAKEGQFLMFVRSRYKPGSDSLSELETAPNGRVQLT